MMMLTKEQFEKQWSENTLNTVDWFDTTWGLFAELEEAQLNRREWHQKGYNEAMKPKTCEGCVYGVFGVDSFGLEIECTLAYRCSRGQDDMFKPKDNA